MSGIIDVWQQRYGRRDPLVIDGGGGGGHGHHGSEVEGPFSNISVLGDFWTTSWNGANPADLSAGPDLTADAGVYIDSSVGAIQAQILYAKGGALGGWVIGATSLMDAAGMVGLSSAVTAGDDIRFWAGHATPSSAPFRVTEAGALTASSGAIGGLSVVNWLTFTGSGGVRTAASGARVELTTDSQAKFFDATQLVGSVGYNSLKSAFDVASEVGDLWLSAPAGSNVRALNPVSLASGSAAAPGLVFTADPDTGLYRIGANQVGIAVGGVLALGVGASVAAAVPFRAPDGTLPATPVYSFATDTDTGAYSPSGDVYGIAVGGVLRLSIAAAAVTSEVAVLAPTFQASASGTAAAPAVTFIGDLDTGLYRAGADVLGVATGGVARLAIGTANIVGYLPFVAPAGSAAAPVFTNSGDADTGAYSPGADLWGIAAGGDLVLEVKEDGAVNGNSVLADDGLGTGLREMFPYGTLITMGASELTAAYTMTTSFATPAASQVTVACEYAGQAVFVEVEAWMRVSGWSNGSWVRVRPDCNGVTSMSFGAAQEDAPTVADSGHDHDGTAAGTTGGESTGHQHVVDLPSINDSAGDSHNHPFVASGYASVGHDHPFSAGFTTTSDTAALTLTRTATVQRGSVFAATADGSGNVVLGINCRDNGSGHVLGIVYFTYKIWRR